jgi:predicted acyltransferase
MKEQVATAYPTKTRLPSPGTPRTPAEKTSDRSARPLLGRLARAYDRWTAPSPNALTGRNLAVDAFRGLAIALMIVVNNPGSYLYVYHPLRHSRWHGCTLADFVFPFFLLIVGISIAFSLESRTKRPVSQYYLMRSAGIRSAKLFFLGLLANNFPFYNIHDWRIPGVLQRIALVYCICVLIALKCSLRGIVAIVVILLVGYWGVLSLVPVPGLGAPDLSLPTANIAAWLDHKLLGAYLYNPSAGWDPEGLLSTIPAICLSLIGIVAGKLLLRSGSYDAKIRALFFSGLVLAAAGSAWSALFPFNRWLWTSSFMLFASGLGLLVLSLCTLIMYRSRIAALLSPFIILGSNAITIYLCSSIFSRVLYSINIRNVNMHDAIHNALFASWLSTPNASLGWAIAYTLTMFLVSYWLYIKRITIKI